MSRETKELETICELLAIPAGLTRGPTNVDLIKLILSSLDARAGKQEEKAPLASEKLQGSLAFPEDIRGKRQLLNWPELWDNLKNFNHLLRLDYSSRRQMLLNRLDCTVESFKWKAARGSKKSQPDSERNSPINNLIHEKYERARMRLKDEPDVSISHLLAVRETERDILLNTVASSSNTDCKVVYRDRPQGRGELMYLKRVVIPAVPDRGGRTGEIRAPQKETISQQRRSRGRGGRR